ncbi:unnamed protein product, partial [Tuber aestivum]
MRTKLVPSGNAILLMLLMLFLLLLIPIVAAEESIYHCGDRIKELATNGSLPEEDIYWGAVDGLPSKAEYPVLLLTFAACEKHCGSGSTLHPWETTADTVTTWVLPLVGLVLQAPFESNNFRGTMLLVFRWLGSPIVSMMYIFWNIRVTRKCAIMADMSVGMGDHPRPPSGFSGLRDSLYLLSVVNQYQLNIWPGLREQDMEYILRVGLFDTGPEFQEMRGRVATNIRRERRRGTVQALVSLGWFLVALGISINKAFGDLGEDSSASNLALGLLVCWLPVLVAAAIVDRNPMDAGDVSAKLNECLRSIVMAIPRELYIPQGVTGNEILGGFAGQGRVHWHCGAASSILCTLEGLPDMGRGWLDIYENDHELTIAPSQRWQMIASSQGWQMTASFTLVCSCIIGAFILSYFTPTVGLGCRSAGYMIFGLNSFVCLFIEIGAWVFLPMGRRREAARWFLRLCEFTNFCWLMYIITAQTRGTYNNCRCKSSVWGGGGYVDFE